jgi:hypothetical protein
MRVASKLSESAISLGAFTGGKSVEPKAGAYDAQTGRSKSKIPGIISSLEVDSLLGPS